jgi:tRNA G18 (ribose-2'-O)-methylase SpoU
VKHAVPLDPAPLLAAGLSVHQPNDPADPRLDDYRQLKDRHLNTLGGRFIAETDLVVRRLLESRLKVWSVLCTPPRARALFAAGALRPGYPVFVVEPDLLDQVAAMPVHRGCLAVGERPAAPDDASLAIPEGARTLVVLEDLVDVDNLGAMVRNASVFGIDALVLSPRCADPFYRKAVRVSVGCVFGLPVVRLSEWPGDLARLAEQRGFRLAAAVLDPDATPLERYVRPERVAVLLGNESGGLSEAARRVCHDRVTIRVAPGADSLNVATAGAVLLYALTRPA